jgi:ribonucleotide reductase class II
MLPTDYQSYLHKSRYARFLDHEGRRENWDETVTRYFDYFEQELDEHHGYLITPTLRSELYDAVLNLHVMPSMRAMMTAGDAARRDNLSIYNCAYLPIDRPKAFAEALYILMCGTGVGFSVERQVVKRLPQVPVTLARTDELIVVQDSKQGWAQAYLDLVELLYAGYIPKVDTSLVRPAGARLKTFGGRASGPEPLLQLFEFTTRTFAHALGRHLTSLECHEIMCKVGEIVVVGGVRRSAEISLSNLSDQRMRDAKSGDWRMMKPHLELSNNSVAYTEKPEVGAFMDEWSSLYRSRSGERGIFNRAGAVQKILHLGRRDHRFEFGCNPCVHGDTPLLTQQGYRSIRNLVGRDVTIWNGYRWSPVRPFSTGTNPLVKVHLSDGTELTCTPKHQFVVQDSYRSEHRKVAAANLTPGQMLGKFEMPIVEGGRVYQEDAYSQGFHQGDGNDGLTSSWVYEPKMVCASRLEGEVGLLTKYGRALWKHQKMLPKNFVPLDASLQYRRDWFAGLMDADGTVTSDNGDGLQLSSIDRAFLKNVRLVLTTMGVQAKLGLMHEAGERLGYPCQACYRLCINQADTYRLINEVGVSFERLQVRNAVPQRDARRFVTVTEVEDLRHCEETFCVTEPWNHTATFAGIVTGNCGEIVLRPRGLCNLTEAIVRDNDSMVELREKARLAAILGTWQSTQTRFNFVDPEWAANAEEERLLGVSLTGIYDNSFMRGEFGHGELALGLQRLKAEVISTNRKTAHDVGINPSVATTTVKPSGTVSQLVNSPSGIHQGHAEFYIRRVTGDNKDPVTQFMVDAGIPWEPHASKPQSMTVFSFPVKLGHGTKRRDDVTAIEHLELVRLYNMHWSEHAVSCTISVKEHEWPAVGGWVYDHFDDMAGLSFLPYFGEDTTYKQLPYETISKTVYEQMLDGMPRNIDWSKLAEYEQGVDTVTGTREFACVGNTCEIVDSTKPL